MDGVLPTEEFMAEELVALNHEHKVEICSFVVHIYEQYGLMFYAHNV